MAVKNKTKKEKGTSLDDDNNKLKEETRARQSSLFEFIQEDED